MYELFPFEACKVLLHGQFQMQTNSSLVMKVLPHYRSVISHNKKAHGLEFHLSLQLEIFFLTYDTDFIVVEGIEDDTNKSTNTCKKQNVFKISLTLVCSPTFG